MQPNLNYIELKKQRVALLNRAESFVTTAETAGRTMTENENLEYSAAMAGVNALNPLIATRESKSTLRAQFPDGRVIAETSDGRTAGQPRENMPVLSRDYMSAFYEWLGSQDQKVSAALYEGSSSGGGYAVPLDVAGQIIPLAPTEMGVRLVANVIPTSMDIRLPRAGAGPNSQRTTKENSASLVLRGPGSFPAFFGEGPENTCWMEKRGAFYHSENLENFAGPDANELWERASHD